MDRIKRMNLKNSLFTMMLLGMSAAAVLSIFAFCGCVRLRELIAPAGIVLDPHVSPPEITYLPQPSSRAAKIAKVLEILQIALPILIFTAATLLTSSWFYRVKLREPIAALKSGADRIMEHDLAFTLQSPQSPDELGQLCIAFEKMRETLLENNQTLWRQAEERKRLNAAFAHDLRNPVTVLKGTAKLLRKGIPDGQAIQRLELYTARIEQYIDAMSSIQRLEQIPVTPQAVRYGQLCSELSDMAGLLAPPPLVLEFANNYLAQSPQIFKIDRSVFMTVAENLVGNGARFAKSRISICLELSDSCLALSVTDDGPGFPPELLQNGPKPFGKMEEGGTHFGMGLYTSQILCSMHGGRLLLENTEHHGAKATAFFKIKPMSCADGRTASE